MKPFGSYVQNLKKLYLSATEPGAHANLFQEVNAALDGQAARELRRLVPLNDLRATGTFFTGSGLAGKVADRVLATIGAGARILDPACGAGDLLIACAKRLPSGRGFRETLDIWGRCLLGRDLEPDFVLAARLRLALAPLQRGLVPKRGEKQDGQEPFTEIKVGCGRTDGEVIRRATHIVVNPPFNQVSAPAGCEWTSGMVSAAAVFMDECLQLASSGTRVVAILPDVLRSGDRYRRWRELIQRRARIEFVELFGQFDRWTDIDVFLLELQVGRAQDGDAGYWKYPVPAAGETIGDRFDVSVGAFVPFRHSGQGAWHPYICARGIPPWCTIEKVTGHVRFTGTVHIPPFAVVRRTSRVGDKHRAVATVVCSSVPVVVENHLLVLRPKDGRRGTCEELLVALRRPEIDEWLDQRIRCRHLTVDAVRQLPLWKQKV
jgi:hypothetical protein